MKRSERYPFSFFEDERTAFMAFFTPEKRIQLQSYIEAGLVAATELARKLGCCARTVRREIDRLEAGTLNYTACAAQAHRLRAAGNARPPMCG